MEVEVEVEVEVLQPTAAQLTFSTLCHNINLKTEPTET